MNKSFVAAAAALAVLTTTAQADDAPSPLTANINITTNYKFRGQDQSKVAGNVKPALQGGFDYTINGFYVGNWNSNVGWTQNDAAHPNSNSLEMDFYGGYKGEIIKDLGYDVGILEYAYPSYGTGETTEIYAGLTYLFATVKYSHTVSGKYFGFVEGKNTGYWDLSANYEVIKGLTLNAHAGFTQFSSGAKDNNVIGPNGVGLTNYSDYKLGLTYDLGSGFSVAGAVVGATKKNDWGDLNKTRAILTISKAM